MIEIPIEIGDIVRVGRFKNKRIKVKSIEYDDYGLPIINGRPLLTMRIEKLMPKTEQTNTMKKSDLQKIIREEIQKAITEADPKKQAKGSLVRHFYGYRVGDDLYDAVSEIEDFLRENAPEVNLDDIAELLMDLKEAAYMEGFDDAKHGEY